MKRTLAIIMALTLLPACGQRGENAPAIAEAKELEHALFVAIESDDLKEVEKLIGRDIDVNFKDEEGKTPLHIAVFSGNLKLIELLIARGADLNAKDEFGDTPLHYVVEGDTVDVLKLLLESGADPNVKNGDKETPLHQVATFGVAVAVDLLVASGAQVNAKDKWGDTPLDMAKSDDRESLQAIARLLKHGAESSVVPETLPEAAMYGKVAQVREFLAAGADVNATSGWGRSALQYAAQQGNRELVAILIARGADFEAGYRDTTPMHLAVQEGHDDVVQLLIDEGAEFKNLEGYSILHLAAKYDRIEIAKVVMAEGLEVDHKSWCESTPLHMAVGYGRFEFAKFMISEGADINALNPAGVTPLDLARAQNATELEKYLLSCGARTGEEIKRDKEQDSDEE